MPLLLLLQLSAFWGLAVELVSPSRHELIASQEGQASQSDIPTQMLSLMLLAQLCFLFCAGCVL